jgi:hydroxymethylglutaryl-CoA lyase
VEQATHSDRAGSLPAVQPLAGHELPRHQPHDQLPATVTIREVGPRDGLQVERPIPPHDRAELVLALLDAGITRIEVASFVSGKAVPPMAGAAEVVSEVKRRLADRPTDRARGRPVTITALVPNVRGAADALATGVDELTVTVAASPTYNERNVRRTIDKSVDEIAQICAMAAGGAGGPSSVAQGEPPPGGIPVDAVVSCAFGSPYESGVTPVEVASLVERLVSAGAMAITLADTTGMATPRSIAAVLEAVHDRASASSLPPGLHLHETRGTAMLNAYAALQLGITRFDTSIGGLGGSPFAEGTGGNLSTEDFTFWLAAMGIETGIDLGVLLRAAELAERLVGHELASSIGSSG